MEKITRTFILAALGVLTLPLGVELAQAGSTTTSPTVIKAPATVVLGNLIATYDGTGQTVTVTTTPPGLQVTTTYGTGSTLPVNVGTYTVRAVISDPNYQGGSSGTMTIVPARATVSLVPSSLSAVYNHAVVSASATTTPPGLPVVFAYRRNGVLIAPIDAGTYSVTATVLSFNATGSTTGTLVINPAPATITWGNLNFVFNGQPVAVTATTVPANLPFGFTFNGVPNKPPTSTGVYTVAATISNPNYVGSSTGTLIIAQPVSFASAPSVPLLEASGAWISFGVNPGGVTTNAYFIFSPDPTFATYTQTPTQYLNNTRTQLLVSAYLGLLLPNTTYYYKVVTVSAAGTSTSSVQSFTTLGFETTLIAATAQPAPGTTNSFATLGNAAIDAHDGAVFSATLSGLGTTSANSAGIWANEGNTSLNLVARTGTVAPGSGGAIWASLGDPIYNNSEEIAFSGTLLLSTAVTSTTKNGVWALNNGGLGLLARQGAAAPGTGGALFSNFNGIGLSDQKGVLLSATLANNLQLGITLANNAGIWEGSTNANLTLVLRTGQQTNLGKTIASLTFLPQEACVNGQTRSFGSVTGHVVANVVQTDRSTSIVKVITPSSPITVVTSGDPAIDTASCTFASFSNAAINDNDHVAYTATLKAGVGDTTTANSVGIWADTSSGVRHLVARAGQLAPGAGTSFLTFGDPVYNDHDVVAFYANLAGGGKGGIWCNSSGSVSLVAKQGGIAPGCPDRVTFATFSQLALDDVGGATQCGGAIFMATLTGPGITTTNNSGIFAVDATGTLQLIVRTGDLLIGKTISSLTFLSAGTFFNGQTRSFSPSTGDLFYTATFTDRTQAIFNVVYP